MSKFTKEIQDAFSSLSNQLSPENLTCDGEIRGKALLARRKRILTEWMALEKQVGRKVTLHEVDGWWLAKQNV